MNQELKGKDTTADRIIAAFRESHPLPSPQDWMALRIAHPEFAGEIADAALLNNTTQHLNDTDIEYPLDADAFELGVSKAINMLYEVPSTALSQAQARIAAVQGPRVRALAQDIGLGSASALLSGILVGAIEVPRTVLDRLAARLEVTAVALLECFQRARAAATVPAFKAESGKPEMATQPTPWAEAVRSLRLSGPETQRLLQLKE